jgi:hypothetical protein
MKVGDLIRTLWNPTGDVWLVLKVVSGDDIPEVVRSLWPENKNELFLEVSNPEGIIMHLFDYECEVVTCK